MLFMRGSKVSPIQLLESNKKFTQRMHIFKQFKFKIILLFKFYLCFFCTIIMFSAKIINITYLLFDNIVRDRFVTQSKDILNACSSVTSLSECQEG